MLDGIVNYIIFFGGTSAVLLFLGQLFVRQRRLSNCNLAALFFSLAVILFQVGFILNHMAFRSPWMVSLHITALYLIGPLLYYAYYLVVEIKESIPTKKLFFLIPAGAAFVVDIWVCTWPEEAKRAVIEELFSGSRSAYILALKIIAAGAALQMVVYLSILLNQLFSIRQSSEQVTIVNITIAYIIFSIASIIIVVGAYITGSLQLLKACAVVISFLLMGTQIVGQRYPEFIQLLKREAEKKKYGRSLLTGMKTDALCRRLEEIVVKERLYAYEEISLRQIADELSITAHQLSQLINEKLNMNFNTYINMYRIRDAKEMLIDEPGRSVLSIAIAVGFNSKTSFYDAFHRSTGVTPQAYRKLQLAGKTATAK